MAGQASPETSAEVLTDIKEEAVLARQIIERHRLMLRTHQLQKQPIDLNRVIEESGALLAHDMRQRQVEANLELSSTPCVVDGDPVLLQQVLVNLVRNAVDALAETPAGSRLVIMRSAITAANVEISVCDTGPGFPAEMSGALFTPFVTTKPEGLGIGLPIAQGIVKAHGGTISARKNEEGGATFTVTLPRSVAAVAGN
jgi:signal transduction histidine kinase